MEQMGGCTPDNSIYYPFLRNAVGPMDILPADEYVFFFSPTVKYDL